LEGLDDEFVHPWPICPSRRGSRPLTLPAGLWYNGKQDKTDNAVIERRGKFHFHVGPRQLHIETRRQASVETRTAISENRWMVRTGTRRISNYRLELTGRTALFLHAGKCFQ
jgi:hypothetical protein